jgi:hypothetical protein
VVLASIFLKNWAIILKLALQTLNLSLIHFDQES